MRFIVIDMQSTLVARAFERILRQDLCDCTPIVSEDPRNTAEQCRLFQADNLIGHPCGKKERRAFADDSPDRQNTAGYNPVYRGASAHLRAGAAAGARLQIRAVCG